MAGPGFTDRTHWLLDARTAKTYAAGAAANRSGALKTTNPHGATVGNAKAMADTVANDAWDAGWDDANAPAGGQTDYDMSLCGYPVAGKPAPELDGVVSL